MRLMTHLSITAWQQTLSDTDLETLIVECPDEILDSSGQSIVFVRRRDLPILSQHFPGLYAFTESMELAASIKQAVLVKGLLRVAKATGEMLRIGTPQFTFTVEIRLDKDRVILRRCETINTNRGQELIKRSSDIRKIHRNAISFVESDGKLHLTRSVVVERDKLLTNRTETLAALIDEIEFFAVAAA
jgi:hypothetical protein